MRDVAIVAFRITAIFFWVYGLRFFPKVVILWPTSVMGGDNTEFYANAISFAAPVFMGCLLWFFSKSLASRLFGEAVASPFSSLSGFELQSVAFSVVGLVVLVSSIRDIVWTIVFFVDSGPNLPRSNLLGTVASALLTVGVGLWLLLGSRGIVGAIHGLRKKASNPQLERDA
jgi:hypothetical protein